MRRLPGPLGSVNGSAAIDSGTLTRSQSPTPKPTGSSPSFDDRQKLGVEEFLAQSADQTLWYCKIAVYGRLASMQQASDHLNPSLGGPSYGSISFEVVEQISIEKYQQRLYDDIQGHLLLQQTLTKLLAEGRLKYLQSLDSPYGVPKEVLFPDQFNKPHRKDVLERALDDLNKLLEQKETKFLIDLATWVFAFARGTKLVRVLSSIDLVSNIVTGDYDGLEGVIQEELIEGFFGLKLFKAVMNIKSESVLEIGKWATGKAVDAIIDGSGGGPITGDTTLAKYRRVQSFRYHYDPVVKKQVDDLNETFRKHLAELELQNYKPTGSKGDK